MRYQLYLIINPYSTHDHRAFVCRYGCVFDLLGFGHHCLVTCNCGCVFDLLRFDLHCVVTCNCGCLFWFVVRLWDVIIFIHIAVRFTCQNRITIVAFNSSCMFDLWSGCWIWSSSYTWFCVLLRVSSEIWWSFLLWLCAWFVVKL